jgi:hypothetical protein
MRQPGKNSTHGSSYRAQQHCNHPLAVVIDPTGRELSELEQMLAKCPICSQWSPGDGPIMAIVSSEKSNRNDESKELS